MLEALVRGGPDVAVVRCVDARDEVVVGRDRPARGRAVVLVAVVRGAGDGVALRGGAVVPAHALGAVGGRDAARGGEQADKRRGGAHNVVWCASLVPREGVRWEVQLI